MCEAFMHAVTDRTIVVERGEHFLDLEQYLINALNVEEGLLLAGKGGIGQVFGGGGGADREAGFGILRDQSLKMGADVRLESRRKWRLYNPLADLIPRRGQGA